MSDVIKDWKRAAIRDWKPKTENIIIKVYLKNQQTQGLQRPQSDIEVFINRKIMKYTKIHTN